MGGGKKACFCDDWMTVKNKQLVKQQREVIEKCERSKIAEKEEKQDPVGPSGFADEH